MITLPRLRDLPVWPAASEQQWGALTVRAGRLARGAGDGRRLQELRSQVEMLIDQRDLDGLRRRLSERVFARAVASVWLHDDLRARASMTPELVIGMFEAQGERPSRLLTATLATLLFRRFDTLDEWHKDLFEATAAVVHDGTQAARARPQAGGGVTDVVETIRRRGDLLLSKDSPRRVADEIGLQDDSLGVWLRANGLLGMDNGRFGQLLRQNVYLRRIADSDPTDTDNLGFLADLDDPDTVQASAVGGLQFGHEVLQAMTARRGANPCEMWIDALVAIGGDPRLEHTGQWRRWWHPLPEESRAQARRWMSTEDLRLFLEAVENYGLEMYSDDLDRMFPARKTFMWGLFELGLVRETRLIMGSRAARSVRRQLGHREPHITALSTLHDTAVIYIDCGSFHIVEGSHSFQLYLYAGRPTAVLTDRSKPALSPQDLKIRIPGDHARSSPHGWRGQKSIRHQGLWQKDALRFIVEELGIAVDPQRVLTPEDYYDLKTRHGLPVLGSDPLE
jgi:hypothetical protein